MDDLLWLALALLLVGLGALEWIGFRGGRQLGTFTQRASYRALHAANLAAPALRGGLTRESASKALPHLRTLLGAPAVVLADQGGALAAENVDAEHLARLEPALRRAMTSGRPQSVAADELDCQAGATCPYQAGVVVPVHRDGAPVGALATMGAAAATAGLLRLTSEVAQLVSTQLELAELDRSRQRADQAELRFLRAQISPHFIYNALTAIESFVRTDPERARTLLVGFADFTRYSYRAHGQFVTIAEELRLVDTYLDLERARFGDRLRVTLRVAPEVLGVAVPSLTVQPLVENAVRHGIEPSERRGQLSITISDAENEALIFIEDNGVGAEPAHLRRVLAGLGGGDAVGLHNVDERLRAVFGDDHGLVLETAPGSGTKVTMRVPKSHAGARV